MSRPQLMAMNTLPPGSGFLMGCQERNHAGRAGETLADMETVL